MNKQNTNIEKIYGLYEKVSKYGIDDNIDQIKELLKLQKEDGSFANVDDYNIETIGRIEEIYKPTYYAIAILMKYDNNYQNKIVKESLLRAMDFATGRNLKGKGWYDDYDQMINVQFFINNGLVEWMRKNDRLNTKFINMIKNIIGCYKATLEKHGSISTKSGDNTIDLKEIVDAFEANNKSFVFVYGSLLKDKYNHYLLKDSTFISKGYLYNYSMFDIGSYPGIVKGEGVVIGEVYEIDNKTMKDLDWLENEGVLYKKVEEEIMLVDGKKMNAFVYVFLNPNNQTFNFYNTYIQEWGEKEEYVYYVCYGSNLLYSRFMLYINGGEDKNIGTRYHRGCKDKSCPVENRKVIIGYNRYFAGKSAGWGYKGTAFLDITKKGHCIGRAYLIKKSQYLEVKYQEGRNYQYEVELPSINGIKAVTFTNEHKLIENEPSKEYLEVIAKGEKEMEEMMNQTNK